MIDAQRFAATASAYDLPPPTYDADLVSVARGTPMGELFRRYWHPVYVSAKLKDLPVQVRALGEDVILFRKPQGDVGAVYPRCIHRGTSLLWGKVTHIGIRCCYHGWTFETDGTCTDQPCEPNRGGRGRNAVRQPWYPAEELYGFVWVYMGPLDRKPPLPRYDLLETLPDGWEIIPDDTSIPSAGAGYLPCNWLQTHENGMDPHHVPILHEHQFPPMMSQAEAQYTFEKQADRVRGRGSMLFGPMMMDFKVELPCPNVRIIPDPTLTAARPDGKGDSVAWTLPVDETDTIVFTALTRPIGAPPGNDELYNGKAWKALTFEEHQRYPGDFEAQVGQGVITYHSEEHLVSSDKGVVLYRRMLQSAIRDMAEGRDPPLAFGAESILVETWSGVTVSPNPAYAGNDDEPVEEAAARAAPGETATGAAGHWTLRLATPMGEQILRLLLAQDGSALTGTLTSPDGDAVAIAGGNSQGHSLQWKADVRKPLPMTMKFDVTLDGDTLAGKFKPGMFPSGKVTGRRG